MVRHNRLMSDYEVTLVNDNSESSFTSNFDFSIKTAGPSGGTDRRAVYAFSF